MIVGNLEKKHYAALIGAILVVASLFVIPRIFGEKSAQKESGMDQVATEESYINPFDLISVEAKSAYVLDVLSGEILYSKNAESQLPLASLSKLMSALVASEHIPDSAVVVPGLSSISEEGDSGLLAGEEWRLSDLLDLTLMSSSNDGANALALAGGRYLIGSEETLDPHFEFVREMNRKAGELGLSQTFFLNESGLDLEEDVTSGGYGSAKDVANLLAHILTERPQLIEATSFQELELVSLSQIAHRAENTNDSVNSIPWLIGGKTGFTDLAGGNLVVAFDAGLARPVVVSVMGSTLEGRFLDIEVLAEATFKYIATKR